VYALPTVEIVCETMGLPIASIETEQSIYESSKSDLFGSFENQVGKL